MIKNIVFDFGKVLVDYDFVRVIRQFFHSDDDVRRYCDIVLTEDFMNQCDRGDLTIDQLVGNLKHEHPQYAEQLQLFADRYDDFVIGEMPGMNDLLTRLCAKGYKLYGLTNWCLKVHGVMQRYGIFRHLDGWVISSEEHLIKPDVAIYQRLCSRYGLEASECLFADDKPVNIEGARRAGMQGVVFENAAQFEAHLVQIGVL